MPMVQKRVHPAQDRQEDALARGGGQGRGGQTRWSPVLAQRAASEGEAQGCEELSLLPECAPSEGPRLTAAVESSSHPCLVR